MTTCLYKENRWDTITSQRLCEFVSVYLGFAEATVKIKCNLLEIMHQDGESVSLMPYYFTEYLDEMLYLNLHKC